MLAFSITCIFNECNKKCSRTCLEIGLNWLILLTLTVVYFFNQLASRYAFVSFEYPTLFSFFRLRARAYFKINEKIINHVILWQQHMISISLNILHETAEEWVRFIDALMAKESL